MLGPSHALSGAAVWLAASFGATEFARFHQSPAQIAIGTAMCAGGALVPDLDLSGRVTTDKGGATVAPRSVFYPYRRRVHREGLTRRVRRDKDAPRPAPA